MLLLLVSVLNQASSESLKFLIESALGENGVIAGVRIAQDQKTGKARGFAHIDFFESTLAERLVNELNGLEMNGRPMKFDLEKMKMAKEIKFPEPRVAATRKSGSKGSN